MESLVNLSRLRLGRERGYKNYEFVNYELRVYDVAAASYGALKSSAD